MNIKRILLLTIIATLVISCLLGCNTDAESSLKQEFKDNGRNQPYSNKIPLSEMDFSVYDKYVNISIGAPGINYIRKISLPCEVDYYNSNKDTTPAFVLQKGTEVYVLSQDETYFPTMGYGLQCWPDYEIGWRYGQPFMTSDFRQSTIYAQNSKKYYVKTEQLFAVFEEFYKYNPERFSAASFSESQKKIVLIIDTILYAKGAFCSPDLEANYDSRDSL